MTATDQVSLSTKNHPIKVSPSHQRLFSMMFGDFDLHEKESTSDDKFVVHRKMLRRRSIRKEQKEKARREKRLHQEQTKQHAMEEKGTGGSTKFIQTLSVLHLGALSTDARKSSPRAAGNEATTPLEFSSPFSRPGSTSDGSPTPSGKTFIVPCYSPLRSRKHLRF